MSDNGSEDEFELSNTDSPPALADLLTHPFRTLIEAAQPIFTGRVTRSRTGAIPPLENPNSDFLDEVELALQNQEVVPTPPLASRARNLGATATTLFSDNLEAQDAETRFSFADMARLIDIMSSKIQQPPPLVSQPKSTVGSASIPTASTPKASSILSVPISEYLDTTSAQSKFFFSMPKFSNSGKDNRDNMETFMVALGECKLLTLAKGDRELPVISARNPGGYSPRSLVLSEEGLYDVIPADDIYKRLHDLDRLLVILNMVTGKDLHYLIKRVIADNDAVLWFKTIYDHINGTKNSDIRKATDQLHSLKLKSTQTIQENVATIEEAFRVLKVASGVPVTDDQKLYHLQEKLEHDARFGVLSIMASSKTSKASLILPQR